MRCQTSLTFFVSSSQVQATIAVESRFTDASTPIQTGNRGSLTLGVSAALVQASHQAISTKLLSEETHRFSMRRKNAFGRSVPRICSIQSEVCHGATGS